MKKTKNPAAVKLGALGGKAKSDKKTEAVKANGKKGGRPLHPCIICGAKGFASFAEKQAHYDKEHGPAVDIKIT